ncbi:MAG TPA: tetratricopeptide repeat protein, partial [Terriglobales bacterium]
ILRCLEKNPDHRYQTCLDLAADLRRVVDIGRANDQSLVVLYFENMSGDQNAYFRDGITEDITTELARMKELRLFSRSAVLPYRDKPVTPSFVGQKLGAAYVLEGSVRREGERLRVSANLVKTRTGLTLWAERYDREFRDIFAIQEDIARSIAAALKLVLTEKEVRAISKPATSNVSAYDFYLRGRHFFHQFRRRGYVLAREMFEKAIEADPKFARAYAGIADCWAFEYMYWDSRPELLEQADAASRKALDLDPTQAEGHASRGMTASLCKRFDEAQTEFETAIRLNPKLFEAYYFFARLMYSRGNLEEACQIFEQASRVSEEYQALMLWASTLNGLGRSAEAAVVYRRGVLAAEKHLEFHPEDVRALYFGANGLTQLGEKDRARRWVARALDLEGEEPLVVYNVACVYALLGDVEPAIDCLERSVTKGFAQKEWMKNDPDLECVRAHPRFKKLVGDSGNYS